MVDSPPQTSVRPRSRQVCPQCGALVYKTHRRLRDRLVGVFHRVRRYRCRAPGCGWQGLLSRADVTSSSRTELTHSFIAGIVVGALLITLVAAAAAILWNDERAEPLPLAAGLSLDGVPLEPDDPRSMGAAHAGTLRRGCVWGGPGESPYPGTLAAALAAARLPGEIIRKIEVMRDGRIVSDRLEISTAGIRTPDNRRFFGHTANAMTLGDTLCFNTKVNLPAGTIISADLYELVDENDSRFTIMVIAQGGHVALVEEQPQR